MQWQAGKKPLQKQCAVISCCSDIMQHKCCAVQILCSKVTCNDVIDNFNSCMIVCVRFDVWMQTPLLRQTHLQRLFPEVYEVVQHKSQRWQEAVVCKLPGCHRTIHGWVR